MTTLTKISCPQCGKMIDLKTDLKLTEPISSCGMTYARLLFEFATMTADKWCQSADPEKRAELAYAYRAGLIYAANHLLEIQSKVMPSTESVTAELRKELNGYKEMVAANLATVEKLTTDLAACRAALELARPCLKIRAMESPYSGVYEALAAVNEALKK